MTWCHGEATFERENSATPNKHHHSHNFKLEEINYGRTA